MTILGNRHTPTSYKVAARWSSDDSTSDNLHQVPDNITRRLKGSDRRIDLAWAPITLRCLSLGYRIDIHIMHPDPYDVEIQSRL